MTLGIYIRFNFLCLLYLRLKYDSVYKVQNVEVNSWSYSYVNTDMNIAAVPQFSVNLTLN
jgi:hypothetical protein